jgi:SprT protein
MKPRLNFRDFVPESSIPLLEDMMEGEPVALKISRSRQTKWGDFRAPHGAYKLARISVNGDLSKEAFLLTLVHEWAHYKLWKARYRGAPHGVAWKKCFTELMLPFLESPHFPEALLPLLKRYFRNPSAAISSSPELYAALIGEKGEGLNKLNELQEGSRFIFRSKTYERGALRRTRILCMRLDNKKQYLFMANTAVQSSS